ncbi:hypothetical protein BDV39DRAFT_208465 [Aspergillus sergii]|uniref:Uncharacterized protein n=1 Tax=Aspergillus sergii TaxID=1034303 RepID=A0A5N6WWP8_9EURO|nr:hypothetical protein BDV39DRAFT_208465 [Aspergillus sergii]
MKFQSLCMSLFCAATLAAALPVEPTTEPPTLPCVPAELAETISVIPGAPKPNVCEEEPKNEKRDGEPPIDVCSDALEAYEAGEEDEQSVGELLDACVRAYGPPYGPPQNEKRQAPPPSGVGGVVSALKQTGENAVGI